MLNCPYPRYQKENYHNSVRMTPPHYINNIPQWLKHKKISTYIYEGRSFSRPLEKVNFRMHFNFLERNKKQ